MCWLIDWLIIKVRDLHVPVPHAQQMVFRPDVIKKLTKQINGNKNVVDRFMYESQKNRS